MNEKIERVSDSNHICNTNVIFKMHENWTFYAKEIYFSNSKNKQSQGYERSIYPMEESKIIK